ncbi:TlpA family protein disulfide reductase [Sunxiuqinia rutila]|uniref:TlpA family protein disulfide reductase n=1 Tax=Sunxiuqinia rutila TaxID=1397841 RepID=UPI003D36A09C
MTRHYTTPIFASLLLTVFTLFSGCQSPEDKASLVHVGQQVPAFTYTNAEGMEKSVSELKGQVVMVTFFATWCGPCLKELPHIQQDIFEKYQDNPKFTLLVIGREHSKEELAAFKVEKDFSLDFIADPERQVYAKFAKQFIPRNYLIDRDGKIIYSSTGFNEDEFNQLKKILEDQLKS